MNTEKVGMYGHSGGGYSTANALLKYSDFYSVGVASSGNYDNLEYNSRWGEKYQGKVSDEIYSDQATRNYVSELKGKLLLIHGDMDDNVYMYHTLRLAHELIQNNKDFDQLAQQAGKAIDEAGLKTDYIHVCHARTLLPAQESDTDLVILAAAHCGKARLIDNLQVNLV